jgi:diguanylate cyclase (GGDEF)-like protein/PAS domain S-box-containing protein
VAGGQVHVKAVRPPADPYRVRSVGAGRARHASPPAGQAEGAARRPGPSLGAQATLVLAPFLVLAALALATLASATANRADVAAARFSAAAAEARRAQVAAATGFLASLALGLLAAQRLRRRVVEPIRAIADAAGRVGGGEPGARVDVSSDGELGELATAVNSLADQLEQAGPALARAAVVETSGDLTIIFSEDDVIRYASPAASRMIGRSSEFLVGQPLTGLVHPDDRAKLSAVRTMLQSGSGSSATAELRISHVTHGWVVVEAVATDLLAHPHVKGMVLSLHDLRERKAREDELVHLALHDSLTKLANRALFANHVEHALAHRRRTQVKHAVLFVDLDGFKMINDSLGHAAGDDVLITVAERMRTRVRPSDIVARLGGDEFAVLLENTTAKDAAALAQRLLDSLSLPFGLHGKEVILTGSVGIAFSDFAQDAEEFLRNADVAMYTAKASGKGRFAIFEPEMHLAAVKRLDLEADLRRAIEHDELVLHYQPIISLASERVTGMEVLVRWLHPERGLVPPMDFIPLAEESGLIRPMGRLILERACNQVRLWHERFPMPTPLRLCVNASVRQIEPEWFFDEVAACLESSSIDPASLTLEITESLFMSDFDATVAKLRRLKSLGIKLAIDDFGTGYSSLNYLRSLPIDILKIDKSFVDGVALGPEQSAVARAVVKLARTFSLGTVAEGIEQPEQLAELKGIGADMGQGYLFARPLDAEGMEAFLAHSGRPAVHLTSEPRRRNDEVMAGAPASGHDGRPPGPGGGR